MAAAEGTAKRKRASGPRKVAPLHLLVTVRDDNGNVMNIAKDNISIEVVKDPNKLIELLTGGTAEGATYVRFTPPAPQPKAPAAE